MDMRIGELSAHAVSRFELHLQIILINHMQWRLKYGYKMKHEAVLICVLKIPKRDEHFQAWETIREKNIGNAGHI